MGTQRDGTGARRAMQACLPGLLCVWLTGVWGAEIPTGPDGNVVHIQQCFDDDTLFKPGQIVGNGDADAVTGAWTGQKEPAFEIVTAPVRSAPYALRITRVDTLRRLLLFRTEPLPAKHNFTVSFWAHADLRSSLGLFLYGDREAHGTPAGGISLVDQCRLRLYNPALPGVDKWVLTGQRAPQSAWFRCQLRVDVVQQLYWLVLTTEAGQTTESEPFPFLTDSPVQALQFLNVPPAGNSVVIDDVEVTYERAAASTVSGRHNWAPEGTLDRPELRQIADANRETGVTLARDAATFDLELKTNSPVDLIRIYSGRRDGSGRVAACQIQGHNAAGQAPLLVSKDMVSRSDDGKDYAEYAVRPDMLSSLAFKLYGADGEQEVFLREVEVYSPPIPPASVRDSAFAKLVYGEFRLPVYENQELARLHLFNVRDDGKTCRVGVTLTERFGGTLVVPTRDVDLPPGETTVEFPVATLANGSYIATVEDRSSVSGPFSGGRFRRLLRVQHLVPFTNPPVHHLTGKRLFFPDDHYLARYHNLSFRSCKGRVVQAVEPTAKSADFTQLGRQIYFDEEGKLNVTFRRLDRRWMRESKDRDFVATATSDALDTWVVKPLQGPLSIPPQGAAVWDPDPPQAKPDWRVKQLDGQPVPLRFYDPETDGKVILNQVAVRRTSRSAAGTVMQGTDLDWSAIQPLGGSVWPVWFKAPGVGLVLRRESLLQEMPSIIGDMEDPKAANDNWGGQFLSDDGTTLTYIHANVLRRFPPFNAPWDNLAKCSRILTVYRTTDGINFERSYMALPDEREPPASQHYGATIRRAARGDGLRLAYLLRYRAYTQQIDTVISYSWDGVRWDRFCGGEPLAANGPHGSSSAGHIMPGGAAVERNGKVYLIIQRMGGIYHFQSEVANSRTDETIGDVTAAWMKDHYGPRQLAECPLFAEFGSWEKLAEHTRNTGVGVGVLIYRKDGLFCVEGTDQPGEFLTEPIVAAGALQVNAEIATGGFLRLELKDAAGDLLPDYSGPHAVQIGPGDYLDTPVRFGTQDRMPAGTYRIQATMVGTKLYTITFADR